MKIMSTALVAAALGGVSLVAQDQVSLTVNATMDIYRAGGYNDGSNGAAPVVFTFPAGGWRTMTFPSVGGQWGCQNGEAEYGADGETSGQCLTNGGATNFNSIGTFSGIHLTDFQGPLVGMFLADTAPTAAPAALRFYVSNSSDGGVQTGFLILSPQLGQVFFIGDGLTGTGTGVQQTFVVPAAATHLYLGYLDNCAAPSNTVPSCYSDNVGSLSVTARLQYYLPDWYNPTLSSAPSARIGPALAYDAGAGYTLLFGGSTVFAPVTTYNDTWIWRDGWTQVFPATSPAQGGSLAYDPTTGTVVLFGGSSGAETWLWDGLTWAEQFPAASPSARGTNQSMAYDAVTGTVVLFGGDSNGSALADTWEWSGTKKTWTQVFPATSPSPRRAPLAYDPLTKTVVLFGGDNGKGDCCDTYYNDTWTWNGINWTQQAPASSPPGRTEQSMAYDPSLLQVVMTGGYSTPGEGLSDEWAWDGTTWTQLGFLTQPSARWGSSMDFDYLTNGLVLFGGETTGDNATNQTWLLIPIPLP